MKTVNTQFAAMIMGDYRHLYFIVCDNSHVLAVNEKNNKAHFFYSLEDFTGSDSDYYHTSLLCDCNDSAIAWFKKEIKKAKYTLATGETATDYFNTLISNAK